MRMTHDQRHPANRVVENVRCEKPIQHLPQRKTKAKALLKAQAQQEQNAQDLQLPDLRGVASDEPDADGLIDEYRMLAICILLQAFDDLNLTDNYKSPYNRRETERARNSAITFVRGPWFREICDAIGIPHSSAKKAALK